MTHAQSDDGNISNQCPVLTLPSEGFGEKYLEKDPLKEVAHEPLHLLDRLRHQRTTKVLSPEKESKIEELVEKFIVDCKIKGIQVK